MYKSKVTMEDVKKRCYNLYKDEYTIISDVYINNKTKIEVKHNKCGNTWMISTDSFLNKKNGCNYCYYSKKHTIDYVKKICHELNGGDYTIISDTYLGNKSRLDIKHNKCGNTYKVTFNTLSSKKSKCPICNGKQKSNIEIIRKRCEELHGNNYQILSTEYIDASKKIKIKHKCSYEWETTTKSFINYKTGCPKCSISQGEYKIETFLKQRNITYECQKEFDNCKYINNLKFDFYINDLNLCIEFDGKQHFEPVKHFGGKVNFDKTKKRDEIKNNFCFNNNIKLLRISYKDINNVENILNENLNF